MKNQIEITLAHTKNPLGHAVYRVVKITNLITLESGKIIYRINDLLTEKQAEMLRDAYPDAKVSVIPDKE